MAITYERSFRANCCATIAFALLTFLLVNSSPALCYPGDKRDSLLMTANGTKDLAAPRPATIVLANLPATPEEEESVRTLRGLSRFNAQPTDIKVAKILLEFHSSDMGPAACNKFYKDLSKSQLGMKDVIKTKTLIENAALSNPDIRKQFLGDKFAAGGSSVEMALLSYRSELTKDAIRQTIQDFQGKGGKQSIYQADVGGWTNQELKALTFSGDIDFSFVSSDPILAKKMKDRFDQIISEKTGLSSVEFDSVCTAHGKATPDVYIGEEGRTFGDDAMKKGTLKEIDLTTGTINETPIPAKEIIEQLAWEHALEKSEKTGITEPTSSKEPGLSMEMARHLNHDIIKPDIFDPVDSILKASKYVERSNAALASTGGSTANNELDQFTKEITAAKSAGDFKTMTQLLKDHFGISLAIVETGGRPQARLEANKTVIDEYFKKCNEVIWDNARQGLQARTKDLDDKIADLDKNAKDASGDAPVIQKTRAEMASLLETIKMEVEACHSNHVEVPSEILTMATELQTRTDKFLSERHVSLITEAEMKDLEGLRELIKSGKEPLHQVVIAYIANNYLANKTSEAIDKANGYLDILDDKLLGELRNESPEFNQFVKDAKAAGTKSERSQKSRLERLDSIRAGAASSIRAANMKMNEWLNASSVRRGGMKAMAGINLALEADAYVNAYKSEGYQGLATEFFRRRVPFGSAVDAYMAGNYVRTGIEVAYTLFPPLALPEGLCGMIESAREYAGGKLAEWNYDATVDALYEGSTFQKLGPGQGWRLISISYDSPGSGKITLARDRAYFLPELCPQLWDTITPQLKSHPVLGAYEEILGNESVSSGHSSTWPYVYEGLTPKYGAKIQAKYNEEVKKAVREYFVGVIENLERRKGYTQGSEYARIKRIEKELGCSTPLEEYTGNMTADQKRFDELIATYDQLTQLNKQLTALETKWNAPFILQHKPDCSLVSIKQTAQKAQQDLNALKAAERDARKAVEGLVGTEAAGLMKNLEPATRARLGMASYPTGSNSYSRWQDNYKDELNKLRRPTSAKTTDSKLSSTTKVSKPLETSTTSPEKSNPDKTSLGTSGITSGVTSGGTSLVSQPQAASEGNTDSLTKKASTSAVKPDATAPAKPSQSTTASGKTDIKTDTKVAAGAAIGATPVAKPKTTPAAAISIRMQGLSGKIFYGQTITANLSGLPPIQQVQTKPASSTQQSSTSKPLPKSEVSHKLPQQPRDSDSIEIANSETGFNDLSDLSGTTPTNVPKLATAPEAPTERTFIWHSSPNVEFASPETKVPSNQITFTRMGKVKVWVEMVTSTSTLETNQEEVNVIAPAFQITFTPQSGAKPGQEVKAVVCATPEVADALINFRWESPASAERMEYANNARTIGFKIKSPPTLSLKLAANVPTIGETIKDPITANYTGSTYDVRAEIVEPGLKPMVWDSVKKGLVPIARGTYAGDEMVQAKATINGSPKPDPVRWTWSSNEGTTISNPDSATPTLSRHETGSAKATVTARNSEGTILGKATVTFSVTVPAAQIKKIENLSLALKSDRLMLKSGESARLTPLVKGGVAPYHYSWGNKLQAQQTGALFKASIPGKQSLTATVTDSKGSTSSAQIELTVEPVTLCVSLSADKTQLVWGQTAAISAVVTGGSSPYTYSWSGNAKGSGSTAQLTGSSCGKSQVSVEACDACGNKGTCTLTITVCPPQLKLSLAPVPAHMGDEISARVALVPATKSARINWLSPEAAEFTLLDAQSISIKTGTSKTIVISVSASDALTGEKLAETTETLSLQPLSIVAQVLGPKSPRPKYWDGAKKAQVELSGSKISTIDKIQIAAKVVGAKQPPGAYFEWTCPGAVFSGDTTGNTVELIFHRLGTANVSATLMSKSGSILASSSTKFEIEINEEDLLKKAENTNSTPASAGKPGQPGSVNTQDSSVASGHYASAKPQSLSGGHYASAKPQPLSGGHYASAKPQPLSTSPMPSSQSSGNNDSIQSVAETVGGHYASAKPQRLSTSAISGAGSANNVGVQPVLPCSQKQHYASARPQVRIPSSSRDEKISQPVKLPQIAVLPAAKPTSMTPVTTVPNKEHWVDIEVLIENASPPGSPSVHIATPNNTCSYSNLYGSGRKVVKKIHTLASADNKIEIAVYRQGTQGNPIARDLWNYDPAGNRQPHAIWDGQQLIVREREAGSGSAISRPAFGKLINIPVIIGNKSGVSITVWTLGTDMATEGRKVNAGGIVKDMQFPSWLLINNQITFKVSGNREHVCRWVYNPSRKPILVYDGSAERVDVSDVDINYDAEEEQRKYLEKLRKGMEGAQRELFRH